MSNGKKPDLLERIEKTEAPPFLFTRIRERIRSLSEEPAPVSWKLVFTITAIVLLMVNSYAVLKTNRTKKDQGLEQVISTMHLSSSNDLYHE